MKQKKRSTLERFLDTDSPAGVSSQKKETRASKTSKRKAVAVRVAGRKGGIARAKNLSPTKRKRIASKGAAARWNKTAGQRWTERFEKFVIRKANAYIRSVMSPILKKKRKQVASITDPILKKCRFIKLCGFTPGEEDVIQHYEDVEQILTRFVVDEAGQEDPKDLLHSWQMEFINSQPIYQTGNESNSKTTASELKDVAKQLRRLQEDKHWSRSNVKNFKF